ncbi:MAG: FHA domain-containing protein [Anaerolineales bacterium]|nr:FHA domain-containing protein [Anaerolineales bacterium]
MVDPFGYGGLSPYGLGSYAQDLETFLIILRVALFVIGLPILLAGYRIYKLLVYLVGFSMGALVGLAAGLWAGDGEALFGWVGLIVGGGLGALVALPLVYLFVFLSGFLSGAVMVGVYQLGVAEQLPTLMPMAIGGVIVGILLVLIFRFYITALTAYWGATLVSAALGWGLVGVLVLFVIGLAVQYGLQRYLKWGSDPRLAASRAAVLESPPAVVDWGEPGPADQTLQSPGRAGAGAVVPLAEQEYALLILPGGEPRLLRDGLTIGRSPACDLVLADNSVSKLHAVIRQSGGTWFIQDQGSSNGIRVNGQQVRASRLQPGDRVQFGQCRELIFQYR